MTKRRDLVRILERAGFCREDGSEHDKYRHADGREVMVPRHREIPWGTVRSILRMAGVNEGTVRR